MTKEFDDLPALKTGSPYADVDEDGLADVMEAKFGAEVGKNDPWNSASEQSDWSYFDEFMQWLSDERIAGRYPQ